MKSTIVVIFSDISMSIWIKSVDCSHTLIKIECIDEQAKKNCTSNKQSNWKHQLDDFSGQSSTNDDEELENFFPCVSDEELKELSSVLVDDDAR